MKLTLNDLKAKPFSLELKHPITKEGLGVKIDIVGKNSKAFKEKFYDVVEATQGKFGKDQSQAEKLKVADQCSTELVAACIVGWTDTEFFGGEYSPELALEIVKNPELSWVKDQIDSAITEDSYFFQ